MSKFRSLLPYFARALLVLLGALLVAFLLLSIPPDPDSLDSHPHPVTGYEDALQRIEELRSKEGTRYNPLCRLKFMDHGMKTERVIVFIHGYTNCPEQFRQLGELFFERGYNVLIAPMPHMGLVDRINDEQERLTAEELAAYTDGVVDIAQGLGEHVTLAGLSGGGVMSAWAAQKREDLDLAVIIAPSFSYTLIPGPLTIPVMNLYRRLPNFYQWWDPINQLNIKPDYGYPRFSTRALAEILRMGAIVRARACLELPVAGGVLVITNAADISVVNALADKMVRCWLEQGLKTISTYQFDASLKLAHDLIDPSQDYQQIDLVYPILVELITNYSPAKR